MNTNKQNLILTNQALKGSWPVTARNKERAVKEVIDVLDDQEADTRTRMSAIRTLTMMEGLNLKEEENRIRQQPKHIIHTDLSTEELMEKVQTMMGELGLNSAVTPAALEALKNREQ